MLLVMPRTWGASSVDVGDPQSGERGGAKGPHFPSGAGQEGEHTPSASQREWCQLGGQWGRRGQEAGGRKGRRGRRKRRRRRGIGILKHPQIPPSVPSWVQQQKRIPTSHLPLMSSATNRGRSDMLQLSKVTESSTPCNLPPCTLCNPPWGQVLAEDQTGRPREATFPSLQRNVKEYRGQAPSSSPPQSQELTDTAPGSHSPGVGVLVASPLYAAPGV